MYVKFTNGANKRKHVKILAGDCPPKQFKLIQAWIEIHKEELLADWELASNGEQPFKIDPLR